jgi:hypothetical protein
MTWSDVLPSVATGVAGAAVGWAGRRGIEIWRSRQPLHLLLDEDPRSIFVNCPPWVSFPYFFPAAPAEIPPPPPGGPLAWWAWARKNGGIPANFSESQLTLSARVKASLLIDNFQAQVVDYKPRPAGTTVYCPVGGADITKRQVHVALHSFVSTVTFVNPGGAESSGGFAFTLESGEFARFSITASSADDALIYWKASIHAVMNGRRMILDVNKDPFLLHPGTQPWHAWNGEKWVLDPHYGDSPGAIAPSQ